MRSAYTLCQPEPLRLQLQAELFGRFRYAVELAADIATAALFMDGEAPALQCDLTLEVQTASLRLASDAPGLNARHLAMVQELAARTISTILDNQRFPRIGFSACFAQPTQKACLIPGTVELCGKQGQVLVQVHWQAQSDGAISACVETSFLQSAFGLVPYRAMLGAIKVADPVSLKASLAMIPVDAATA